MGCDIHMHAERVGDEGTWELVEGFDLFSIQSYTLFAWLAGVRNEYGFKPLAAQRGLPEDTSCSVHRLYDLGCGNNHSASWVDVNDLLAHRFDYDARNPAGKTYRELLGPYFFKDLDRLPESGAQRLVFWFDG